MTSTSKPTKAFWKKAETDTFPLDVSLGLEPPESLSSDDVTLKDGPEGPEASLWFDSQALRLLLLCTLFQKMTNIFSTGQAHTVYFLAPGPSSAVCGQPGCTRSLSRGSWIPVGPTVLRGVDASAAC